MTGTIQKWGNSQAIRLPKHILENVYLKENDSVQISTVDDKIIIQKVEKRLKHKSFQQRLEEYYGKDFETILNEVDYQSEEIDWGKPVGEEIW